MLKHLSCRSLVGSVLAYKTWFYGSKPGSDMSNNDHSADFIFRFIRVLLIEELKRAFTSNKPPHYLEDYVDFIMTT